MPSPGTPRQPGMTKAQQRRQHAAAEAEAARLRKRRRQWQAGAVVAALVLVVGGVIAVIAANAGGHSGPTGTQATPTTAAAPVWPAPAPAQVPAAVRAAGLPLLGMEATDVHYHAHLDIIVGGKQVVVPAEVGIAGQSGISSMHTHDATGIIHIESPTAATFTLGQFFTEWQVRLSSACVNSLCATNSASWHFYVNGQPYTGDPGTIVLKAHQEIAAVYGNLPAGAQPPAQYEFPAGL